MKPPKSTPPGMLVPIYQRRLHLLAQGAGEVAVLLDGAAGTGTLAWRGVVGGVAGEARVVRYDRAGYGWSDAAPTPLTVDDGAQDLRAALERSGTAGPYLLVGHAYGAGVMRRFAYRYRSDVVGLVLVEPWPERFSRLAPAAWRAELARRQRATARSAALARWGLSGLRAGGRGAPPPALGPWPAPSADHLVGCDARLAAALAARARVARHGEVSRFGESERELESLPPLGELPLIVIGGGAPGPFPGLAPEDAAASAALWQRLQAELARASTRGQLWEAEGAGQDPIQPHPDLVLRAVDELLAGRYERAPQRR